MVEKVCEIMSNGEDCEDGVCGAASPCPTGKDKECVAICEWDMPGLDCKKRATCNKQSLTCDINFDTPCKKGGNECTEFCEATMKEFLPEGETCDEVYTCNLETRMCGEPVQPEEVIPCTARGSECKDFCEATMKESLPEGMTCDEAIVCDLEKLECGEPAHEEEAGEEFDEGEEPPASE